MTRWLNPPQIDIPDSLASLGLSPLVARTLARRGVTDPASARAYLDADAYAPASAYDLPGMDKAVERLLLAIRKGEMICVWGDFDVDGQTATTLLVQALRALNADVTHYIPIRGKESHGVHINSLAPILDGGVSVILTCDTGISARDAIAYARSRGADVVITDHHDLADTLPDATAIVNPKLLPPGHPLATLAGVGVAFKLAEALADHGPWTTDHAPSSMGYGPSSLLDLVALGLIADLALLKDDARYLAQKGLQGLRETERVGLQTLYEFANIQPSTLNETSVSFALGPRLNALGRLGDANPAVELLTTADPIRARVLAAHIEGLNAQRKLLTEQVSQAAEAQLRANPALLSAPVIVLAHASWPGGVVGIVANRLVDRYHKPAVLFNLSDDGLARGSARSIDGLHITQAIAQQARLIRSFGGHPMAAGVALPADALPEFRKSLGRTVEKMLSAAHVQEAALGIDAWIGLEELSLELADSIEGLAPFGPGNPSLTLASRSLRITRAAEIGKNKEHLKLTVQDPSGREQDVLWWKSAGEELPEGVFDLAYTLRAGTFRGVRQLNLEFVALRVLDEAPVELQRTGIAIQDHRAQPRADKLPPAVQVWAEGSDRDKGADRFHLVEAKELAIWTSPPSPAELRAVLESVKPKTVHLYAVAPAEENAEAFLNRLAGLAKYAINQKSGRVTLHELAVASAQRELTVRLGLEWLQSGGHISVGGEQALELGKGTGDANPYAQQELYVAVKGLLAESAAYRKYFVKASDPQGLIEA